MTQWTMPEGVYLKFLDRGRKAVYGTGRWPRPGEWTQARTPVPCESGWHMCRPEHAVAWLAPELWVAQAHPDADLVETAGKVVASRARLLWRVGAWDAAAAVALGADCAEHVVDLTGPDERCVRAISTARLYINGEVSAAEMDAAAADAWFAARGAQTVGTAAVRAARAAARAADAAREPSQAPHLVAWVVSLSSEAVRESHGADGAAARDAEVRWQTDRLMAVVSDGDWSTWSAQ